MRNTVLLSLLITAIFQNAAENENGSKLVCDNLSRCQCNQETNSGHYIPLLNIDCSRLKLKDVFTEEKLPQFVGRLDLSRNNIVKLNASTQISSDTLYYLDFSYNNIDIITETYFQNLTSLVYLNLGYNKISILHSQVFHGLEKLQVINLKSNKIENLPERVFYAPNLQDLILNDNNLGTFFLKIDLDKYVSNTVLNLQFGHMNLTTNNIQNILSRMTELKMLSLVDNPISDPLIILSQNDTYKQYELEYLELSGTSISNLSLINLFWNKIKVLKLNRLKNLKRINGNDFILLNETQTEELYLDHCSQLEEIVFDRINPEYISLKKLSVTYSAMKTLSNSLQPLFKKINEIYLRDDSWICDCRLSWLKQLTNIVDIHQMRCASPEILRNKTIKELPEEEFLCLETSTTSSLVDSILIISLGILFIVILVSIALFIYIYFYNIKSYIPKIRHIGPDSPYYSPITIKPHKAEFLET